MIDSFIGNLIICHTNDSHLKCRLTPVSRSVAVNRAKLVPIVTFSNTVTLWLLGRNTGGLSLKSVT